MELPRSPSELVIESLAKAHNKKDFSCGDQDLDDYLKRYARQNMEYGHGCTYVAVRPEDKRVWGYYTLATSRVDVSALPNPKGCPQYVSAVLMARLGVDSQIARIGVGKKLIIDAFRRSLQIAEIAGIHVLCVDAKDQGAADYYKRFQFHELMDSPLKLYLPIRNIKTMFEVAAKHNSQNNQ